MICNPIILLWLAKYISSSFNPRELERRAAAEKRGLASSGTTIIGPLFFTKFEFYSFLSVSDESKRKLESLLKEKFDNISALRDRLQVGDSFRKPGI